MSTTTTRQLQANDDNGQQQVSNNDNGVNHKGSRCNASRALVCFFIFIFK